MNNQPLVSVDAIGEPAQPQPSVFDRPLTFPPLVPAFILRAQHAFVATDTRFCAAARLLATLWREDNGLPMGALPAAGEPPRKTIKLGSRLARKAAEAGATFMDGDVVSLARAELLFREENSVWNEERLWSNLLSSQALTINLFAPMALDMELATAVWQRLLPDLIGQVARIRFEHSPGRFDGNYFGDGTAFDVMLEIITPDGELGFVVIEVKYAEDLLAPAARHRPRYDETTHDCGLFHDPKSAILWRAGFEQLRREHVMAQLMVDNDIASRGFFVAIAPRLNRRAAASFAMYAAELIDASGQKPHDDGRARVGFEAISLEEIVTALQNQGRGDYAAKLWGRYCDFRRVVSHVMHSLTSAVPGSDFHPGRKASDPAPPTDLVELDAASAD